VIFVDTSVWVAALRSSGSREARHLQGLLDRDEVGLPVVVRLEILAGAGPRYRAKLRRALSALPVYFPRTETWDRIEGWIEDSSATGERLGVVDLLIAALAEEQEAALWSLDRDFERMSRLGYIRLHDTRATA
jgi:predicted nucleic acid-binding protein